MDIIKSSGLKATMAICTCALLLATLSCGGKSGDDGGGGGAAGGGTSGSTISVVGKLDGTTIGYMPAENILQKIFGLFEQKAYAGANPIDNIIAISPDGSWVKATINGDSFTMNIPTGKSYLLSFLNGTTIKGTYKVHSGTGLDALPLNASVQNLNLGTVNLLGGVVTGNAAPADVLQNLNLTNNDIATAYGVMDDGFFWLSNPDVDGNSVLDVDEGKFYTFQIGYAFNPNKTFADIQGAWSDKAAYTYDGYKFYVGVGTGVTLSTGRLWYPAAITPITNICDDPTENSGRCCKQHYFNTSNVLNFFAPEVKNPLYPPSGDYIVKLDGGTPRTFRNVKSRAIDANLTNVYIPTVKLTMTGGKVTLVEWQFHKYNGTDWVTPSDEEIARVLKPGWTSIDIMNSDSSQRVHFYYSEKASGSVVPPAQSFTPARMYIGYTDQAGHEYHSLFN